MSVNHRAVTVLSLGQCVRQEGLGAAATSPSGSGMDTSCVAAPTRLPLLLGWLDPEDELVLSLCAGPDSFPPGLTL